jgi:protein-disulfide isomerase
MAKKDRSTDRAARAAAALEEQRRQELRRRNAMVGGVAAAILAIVVAGYFLSRAHDTTTDVSAPAAGSGYGVTIGPADAPHDVVVYEDFLCPFCEQFEQASRDDFAQLAADGKVRVEYRPFNLLVSAGDYSERSAAAFATVLDESGADVAKRFHDLLYDHQPSESGPFPSNQDIADLAGEAGADEGDVLDALEAGDGKDWVEKATRAADDAGVKGTPTILLDGKVYQEGRTPADNAEKLIDELR